MVLYNYTTAGTSSPGAYAELQQILLALDDDALLERLRAYRSTGRSGWPLRALWSAYIASFHLDLDSINALIRRLEDDPGLRATCGFGEQLPHRTTFNRFVARLSNHPDLLARCIDGMTTTFQDLLPCFGQEVAIDSTDIATYSNPNKKSKVTGDVSDPEARWGVKHSARAKDQEKTEYFFGYKLHALVDANYEIPISFRITSGNSSDSPELRTLMDQAFADLGWFQPKSAMADRGYDALANFEYLWLDHQVDPVIHIRRPTAKDGLYDGLFNGDSRPLCMGMVPMEHAGRTGDGSHIFRCRSGGCHLKQGLQSGIVHCDTVITENPADYLRVLGGRIWRGSAEWHEQYSKRWSVERVFKTLKKALRLEGHYIRGGKFINLHIMMSILTFQASALTKLLAGGLNSMRWMVRQVA